ncbi:MFS transporter, DHA1 family, multidrug resistance protein [Deinococcus reticulitermitis]|uniref:MFS transporter, DHA1 family, multidrug resistance protein n=2 Tax=Deinococcus reticulitermitis TaxID=856736 RepID=A0A1H7BE94_9DEIO|nr:MFS transporter, DHA1 family, multidrug resistance protein [Deinococcus reticulitermitis]
MLGPFPFTGHEGLKSGRCAGSRWIGRSTFGGVSLPLTSPAPFRPSAAQLGLMASNFLMWGGFFAVIPLVTVHFVGDLRWTAASVGLVLGLRQLTQQGLTVFGGAWADQVGPKPLILAGCLLRTLGFTWMGFADSLPVLLAASVLAGVGGGLFDAPKNAALTLVTREGDRTRMFSLMSTCGNLGMVTGPLIGAALIGLGFRTAAISAGAVYLLAALVLALTLPGTRPAAGAAGGGLGGLKAAARDTRFRRFTLVLIGYFILSTQINVLVTLRAVELAGKSATGPLYALSAGLAVLLQYPLVTWLDRALPTRVALVGAVLLVGTALGLMAWAPSFPALLGCVALYSLGTMTVYPAQQSLTARLAPPEQVGSYFGFSAISLGVGGAVGSVIGGWLLDVGGRLGLPALPWLTLFGVSLLTAAGLWWALRTLPRRVRPGR